MRGSYLQLSGRDCLLWTQGDAPSAVGGKNFYKEGKSIPSPLLLRRFAGHGPFDTNCREVLGLSKMNWNNDGLYDRLPVTQAYAKVWLTSSNVSRDSRRTLRVVLLYVIQSECCL